MRIGVDGRALARGDGARGLRQPRGIARYATRLLTALVERQPETEWRVLTDRDTPVTPIAGVEVRRHRGSRRLVYASAAAAGRPAIDRMAGGDLDVVWLPYPAPAAVTRRTPYVLTVHDLSSEIRSQDLGPYSRLWTALSRPDRLARGAAQVMVDSEDTHAQALERWKLDPSRVSLVRPGVWHPPAPAPGEIEAVRRKLGLRGRYFLFVGALEPRKGLDVLQEAFGQARSSGFDGSLVLVGEGPLGDGIGGDGVVLAGRVSDAELGALYADARATVLPSLLEGFGFTPLESLAAGTPAVATDLPALRETLGADAPLVPPGDAGAFAQALLAVDRDEAMRASMLDSGRASLRRLSWEEAADAAFTAFCRAADQRT